MNNLLGKLTVSVSGCGCGWLIIPKRLTSLLESEAGETVFGCVSSTMETSEIKKDKVKKVTRKSRQRFLKHLYKYSSYIS